MQSGDKIYRRWSWLPWAVSGLSFGIAVVFIGAWAILVSLGVLVISMMVLNYVITMGAIDKKKSKNHITSKKTVNKPKNVIGDTPSVSFGDKDDLIGLRKKAYSIIEAVGIKGLLSDAEKDNLVKSHVEKARAFLRQVMQKENDFSIPDKERDLKFQASVIIMELDLEQAIQLSNYIELSSTLHKRVVTTKDNADLLTKRMSGEIKPGTVSNDFINPKETIRLMMPDKDALALPEIFADKTDKDILDMLQGAASRYMTTKKYNDTEFTLSLYNDLLKQY